MESYKIKSKINILSKIVDSFFIGFSCFIVYFGLKTGVSFSKNSYTVFTILLVVFYGFIFIRDFIFYKINLLYIFFLYSYLSSQNRIKKYQFIMGNFKSFIENKIPYKYKTIKNSQ